MKREEVKALFVFIGVLLFLVFVSCLANGAEYRQACCRILNQGDGSTGSGTLVDVREDGSEGLILTCNHLFRDSIGQIIITMSDGKRHGAKLIKQNPGADLAALVIANPQVKPAEVSFQKTSGALTSTGFGGQGIFRETKGQPTGTCRTEGMIGVVHSNSVRAGDSGGGCFDSQGRLVAVVWGAREGETYTTTGKPLEDFLYAIVPEKQCFSGNCQQPQTILRPSRQVQIRPLPSAPQQNQCSDLAKLVESNRKKIEGLSQGIAEATAATQKTLEAQERLSDITDQILARLDVTSSQPTIPGPSGQRGPQGEPGPPGPPGKDATVDIDAIVARVIAELPDATPQPQTEIMHYVLVADENASYWGRVGDRLRKAQEQYSQIRQTPIPDFPIGAVPQLVAYQDGKPLGAFRGARDVENALALISRGDIPKP